MERSEVILFLRKNSEENWKIRYIVKKISENFEKFVYIIQKIILKKVLENLKNLFDKEKLKIKKDNFLLNKNYSIKKNQRDEIFKKLFKKKFKNKILIQL